MQVNTNMLLAVKRRRTPTACIESVVRKLMTNTLCCSHMYRLYLPTKFYVQTKAGRVSCSLQGWKRWFFKVLVFWFFL